MTYPLATLGCTLDSTGISAPSFNDILSSLIATMQSIFGSDIYLGTDSKLYQMLAVFASAQNDSNNATIAAYNSMAPDYAVGAGLSRLVKINAIQRQVPTNSTVALTLVGVAGTVISNGIAADTNGNLWDLPASVTIPASGTITVTATCELQGNIAAATGTVNVPYTPQYGWQSVTNAAAATPGAPVESDATLRLRQQVSTALSSISPSEAILAAVANVTGVEQSAIYVNNTSSTDSNGVPAHSICVVAQGGSLSDVAQAINRKKAPGVPTYGTTSVTITDPAGMPVTINLYLLAEVPIYVALTIKALSGYTSAIGTEIVNAVVDFINSLAIGASVRYSWIEGAAGLIGLTDGLTFEITALGIGLSGSPPPTGTTDLPITFYQIATCAAANVALTVT